MGYWVGGGGGGGMRCIGVEVADGSEIASCGSGVGLVMTGEISDGYGEDCR